MLEVKEDFLIILVSLTASISKLYWYILINAKDNQNSCLMNIYLSKIQIAIYFFQEMSEFEVGQYHSN